MTRTHNRDNAPSLAAELPEHVSAHKKAGLARAEKLDGRRKSDRAREAAQARWNAAHGKGKREGNA
jgi:hypothetical protein